jgi:energy-coupling factor transporter ATP-binding protein EcfA2
MTNPFSLTFGIEPKNYIARIDDNEKIIAEFSQEESSNYIYLLTGVRGSGKTAMLSSISNRLKSDKNWIVADAGPKENILENVAAEIYESANVKHLFLQGEFSFSFQGIGFSIKGKEPVSNVMTLLKKMLSYLQKRGIKVLITFDEVDNSEATKLFIEGYASLLRQGYPMRLLMTGLYENVSKLQENKSLTFLYRAPKIQMGPLSLVEIRYNYEKYLNVDSETAATFAKLTNGYAYAYQVLGYLLFEKDKKVIDAEVLREYDRYLGNYVYEKVFAELTPKEIEILLAFKTDEPVRISELSKKTGHDAKYLGVYRDQLIKKGILVAPAYGVLQIALPRFNTFLLLK